MFSKVASPYDGSFYFHNLSLISQNGAGPTPPGSNKPSSGMGTEDPDNLTTKLKQTAKMESSSLPHDQLGKSIF